MAKSRRSAAPGRLPVNLALQGGGAHGAFAWGVLDALLEDGRLDIKAISATSAGSMNAVVMAYGMSQGGVAGARAKLADFWRAVSDAGLLYSPVRAFPWTPWLGAFGLGGDVDPGFLAFTALTQLYSPYQLNPWNFNPLRDALTSVVDFAALARARDPIALFLAATNVRSGKIQIFENDTLNADRVLASACLPYLFQAVEIDGEYYWDGGYMGNPAIYPLIYHGASSDVIVVHINPIVRSKVPTTAPEILDRVNEISFNSSLMREMRAISFVSRLIDDERLDTTRYKRMLIHAIQNDVEMAKHGFASKLDTNWDFLCQLRDTGRRTTIDWLAANIGAVGRRSSVDVAATYL